ncbi:MAG: branched-chain amino acid ABC transporter permease [Burkholderiales bacterium]|nr:branched-chain amino acid ABC transporter permease [Burkholderiales bacterium]OJX06171.1 MAG: hypothetical protein BGO72_03995 [Burkholderiales bacterium 70-64]
MYQLVVNGLTMGCIYALIAFGFILIYNAVGAVNFAQGDLVMVGSYFGVLAVGLFGLDPFGAMVVVIAGSAAAGYVFQRLAYYPLRDGPTINVVISCLGAGIFLRNAAQNVAGPEPYTMKPFFGAELVELSGLAIPSQSIFVVVLTVILFAVQYWFFFRTSLGRMLRATANDKYAARLAGIPVRRMIALAFVISSVMAGMAGFVLVPIFLASPNMGFGLVVKAWIGVVIGGFGSVPGAIVGGILVGLLETFTASLISSDYKDVITMLVLLAVLFLRPQGIFSEPVQEKV